MTPPPLNDDFAHLNDVMDVLFRQNNTLAAEIQVANGTEITAQQATPASMQQTLAMEPLSMGALHSSEADLLTEVISHTLGYAQQSLSTQPTTPGQSCGMMPSNHFNDQPLMFHEQPSFLGEQDMAGGGAAQILASQLLPPETATSNFTGSATPSESSMTVPRTGNFSASTPSPENIRAKRRTPEQIIESRLQRRRERNRLAAQKSRQRRLSYIQELEERLEHYEQEITHLRQVLQSSHQVICDLRIQLENKP